jgi:phosphatidylglycerol lysyltransferase
MSLPTTSLSLLRPRDPLARARELVLAYGWNATAYQIVNPGITLWFARDNDAVVGYVERRRTRVVAGAPVCPPERLAAVVAEFEQECADCGRRVCYFGAEERLEALLSSRQSHAMVQLGSQPSWNPSHWSTIIESKASLRAQLNRARNKSVSVSTLATSEATSNPDLRRVLDEWLATRGLPPMHFLVEPETLSRLFDRRIFVARLASGDIVAFLVASPAPARHGWLIEQFVRGRKAPNGTVELLLDTAMRVLAAEGFEYVTLGLAPLSRHGTVRETNPFWLRLLLELVRAHGRRFYNFEGLDRFKAKFQPEQWEPVYAIVNERQFSPGALYAIAAAFSDRSPVSTILRALWRAARTELRWLRRRLQFGKRGPLREQR